MKGSLLASIAAISFALSACDDDMRSSPSGTSSGAEGTVSSCDLTVDVAYCLDFDTNAPAGTAKGSCESSKKTLGYNGILSETSSCGTAARVGSCAATITGVFTIYRYYGPKFTTATAQANCGALAGTSGAGGTFKAN